MRTKRNGNAIGLYCEALGCETVYADIFPDRVLIYSRHYGRLHSTLIFPDIFRDITVLACEGTPRGVECACGQFNCAVVEDGQVAIEARHKITSGRSAIHQNCWGAEELEQIGIWLGLIRDRMPTVERDLTPIELAS